MVCRGTGQFDSKKEVEWKEQKCFVDDSVIIADPNAVRGNGYYRRPITKLCVVYPADGFKD